jgi:hypothetical protein
MHTDEFVSISFSNEFEISGIHTTLDDRKIFRIHHLLL